MRPPTAFPDAVPGPSSRPPKGRPVPSRPARPTKVATAAGGHNSRNNNNNNNSGGGDDSGSNNNPTATSNNNNNHGNVVAPAGGSASPVTPVDQSGHSPFPTLLGHNDNSATAPHGAAGAGPSVPWAPSNSRSSPPRGRLRYETVYMDSPDTGFVEGQLRFTSRRRIPADDPHSQQQQWIFTTWLYLGQDNATISRKVSAAVASGPTMET